MACIIMTISHAYIKKFLVVSLENSESNFLQKSRNSSSSWKWADRKRQDLHSAPLLPYFTRRIPRRIKEVINGIGLLTWSSWRSALWLLPLRCTI